MNVPVGINDEQSRSKWHLVSAERSEGEKRNNRRGKMKGLARPDRERDHISGSANGSALLLEYGD
jgi:hypothetical protein